MPVNYTVKPNPLTKPASYSCITQPVDKLGINEIARQINLHNPTIPEQTAVDVIEKFSDEILYQLSIGNWVTIESFCSFSATIVARLNTATESLPPNAIECRAKPSAPFKKKLRQDATYTRLAYIEKAPNVSEVVDTNSGVANWARDVYGMRVNGSDLGFDQTNTLLGVWIETADGTLVKQEKISLNNPSSLIITPEFETSLPDGEHVDLTLVLKNKYTPNGQIRTSSVTNRIRATNTTFNLFAAGLGSSPVTVTTYAGADKTVQFVASINPDSTMSLAVGEIGGVLGSAIDITAGTTTTVLPGLGDDVTVTINDYATLYQTALDYQRYMVEVCALTATP